MAVLLYLQRKEVFDDKSHMLMVPHLNYISRNLHCDSSEQRKTNYHEITIKNLLILEPCNCKLIKTRWSDYQASR